MQRLRLLRQFFSPVFKWGAVVYTILSFLGVVKDSIRPPYSDWRIWDFLPDWPVPIWLAMFVVFIAIGTIESAYEAFTVAQAHGGTGLVGIDKEWRRRKAFTPSTAIALFLAIGILALGWVNYAVPQVEVLITGSEIGWKEGDGNINLQSTDFAEADKVWAANVHYKSTTGGDILRPYQGYLVDTSKSKRDRNTIEDYMWAQFMATLKFSEDTATYSPRGRPNFTTLDGPILNRTELDGLKREDQSVYFLMVILDKRHRVLASACIYRVGISPAVHNCHEYN